VAKLEIPDNLPGIALRDTTLLPQSLLPVHIFEPHYQRMLKDCLASHRLLLVVNKAQKEAPPSKAEDTLNEIAGVGVIKLSSGNSNGSSNIMLQGLFRVRISSIISEQPYPYYKIEVINSPNHSDPIELQQARKRITKLAAIKTAFGAEHPHTLKQTLAKAKNLDELSDLASDTLVSNPKFRQLLMDTLDPAKRIASLCDRLTRETALSELSHLLSNGDSDLDFVSN